MLQKNQSRPVRSLSIMWVIGQAGHSNLANGLKGKQALLQDVISKYNAIEYNGNFESAHVTEH